VDDVTTAWVGNLDNYLAKGIHEVNSRCIPHLWQTILPLAQRIGVSPIAEEGVFEDKFLIGLCKTFGIGASIPAAAIDVFDIPGRCRPYLPIKSCATTSANTRSALQLAGLEAGHEHGHTTDLLEEQPTALER